MASAASISASKVNLKLTSNDSAVLQALFDNGEGSFQSQAGQDGASSQSPIATDSGRSARVDASLPSFPACSVRGDALQTLKDRELAIIRRIQDHTGAQNNSSPAQQQQTIQILNTAIEDLSSLISEHPDYPPLYANRAQALRLLIHISSSSPSSSSSSPTEDSTDFDRDATIFLPQNSRTATMLLSDLGKAISLASPPSNHDSVSPAQVSLLSNTYTHRGYLLLKAGKIRKEEEEKSIPSSSRKTGGPEQLLSINSRDELEEMASQDFFQAGRYGNEVAKQLSVQTNPYAKMCGAIVKEALKKEIEEFQS